MWFKNLQFYQFPDAAKLSAEQMQEAFERFALPECPKFERTSAGWVSPLGRRHESLVHSAVGCHLIALGVAQKVLPGGVVREALDDEIAVYEQQHGKRPPPRDKRTMKEDIEQKLLAEAFVETKCVLAYIDQQRGWLVVDSSSANRAEEVTSLLRKTLGSLDITLPCHNGAARSLLTGWLATNQPPREFDFGDEAELKEPGEHGSIVRCKKQDLTADEIREHLLTGKQVTKLALRWGEKLGLVLTEDLTISRLRFLDVIKEQLDDIDADNEIEELDAQFVLMTGEVAELLERIVELQVQAKPDPKDDEPAVIAEDDDDGET